MLQNWQEMLHIFVVQWLCGGSLSQKWARSNVNAGSCNNIVFVSLETRVWQLMCIPIEHIFFFLSKWKWTSRNFYRLLVRRTETNHIVARKINFQHDIHAVFKICLFSFDCVDCSVTVEIVRDRIGSRDLRSLFEKFRAISLCGFEQYIKRYQSSGRCL